VIGHHVAQFVEPEQSHGSQHAPFVRNGLVHDDIKGTQAVAGHHENFIVAYGIVFAHLAATQ
jgi:hypothetical protein